MFGGALRIYLVDSICRNHTDLRLDNSEFMRNGDYTPTRFEAQVDAINLIFTAKTQSNPENTVGLMTMGGNT